MDNKRINVLFCLVLIFFLGLTFILMRGFEARRVNDIKDYVVIAKIIKDKNTKIRELYAALMAERQKNMDLNATLTETKSSIDALSQKLATPPTPAPAVATAPAAK